MKPLDLQPTLRFLADLSKNNHKTWFDQHRDEYEQARLQFEHFVDFLLDEFRIPDNLQDLTAKDCTGRIYRDVRFSKDKSPYRTNLWAMIAPGGKKATRLGYYVAIEPQGRSLVAGGFWEPTSEQLGRFRRAMDRTAAEFKGIISTRSFVDTFGKLEGERLKSAPQGYDRSHPEIELLQLKQVMAVHYYPDGQVLAADFPVQVMAVCRAMRPFLDYLEEITSGN